MSSEDATRPEVLLGWLTRSCVLLAKMSVGDAAEQGKGMSVRNLVTPVSMVLVLLV